MTAAPLILGETQKTALRELRERAAASPMDMPTVMQQIRKQAGLASHLERMGVFTIPIPTVFRVTFSIETGHPVGTCRHMSMSSDQRKRAPTPEAAWMIAAELGFVGGLDACTVWMEDIGGGDVAINVVQPVAVVAT